MDLVVRVPDPCVVVLIGASGSGKSTLAAQLVRRRPGYLVLSYDLAQGDGGVCSPAAVGLVHAELADRCARGQGSVVDGTHRQPDRRAAVRDIAGRHGLPVIGVVLLTPLAECLVAQLRRDRRVPAEDVVVQHKAITADLPSLPGEGFDSLIMLTPTVRATAMFR